MQDFGPARYQWQTEKHTMLLFNLQKHSINRSVIFFIGLSTNNILRVHKPTSNAGCIARKSKVLKPASWCDLRLEIIQYKGRVTFSGMMFMKIRPLD
jgi:hypothetical protein